MFRGRARRALLLLTVLFVISSTGLALFALAPAGASDNLSCPSGSTEYKVATNPLNGLSNGQSADFTINGQTFTITKVQGPDPFGDDTFDFTSTVAVVEVLVKGGVDTNVYDFNPAATSGSGLHPPLTSGNQAPIISHVSFCVANTALTTTTTAQPTSTSTSTTSSSTTTSTVAPTSTSTSTSTSTTTEQPTTTSTSTSTSTTTEQPTTTTIAVLGSTTTEAPTSTTTTEPATTTSLQVEGNTSTTVFGTTSTSFAVEGSTVAPTTTVAPSGGTLPFTGGDTLPLAWVGFTALAAGLLFRRRVRA